MSDFPKLWTAPSSVSTGKPRQSSNSSGYSSVFSQSPSQSVSLSKSLHHEVNEIVEKTHNNPAQKVLGELTDLYFAIATKQNMLVNQVKSLQEGITEVNAKNAKLEAQVKALEKEKADHKCQSKSMAQSKTDLPKFSGQEPWSVWYTRFATVGKIRGWTQAEFHSELIPLLVGKAGRYAFGQLPPEIRNDHVSLIAALKEEFDEIVIPVVYQQQFEDRQQQTAESMQAYMSALKSLHALGWPTDSADDRTSRLIARFKKGLLNTNVSFHLSVHFLNGEVHDCVVEAMRFEAISNLTLQPNQTHGNEQIPPAQTVSNRRSRKTKKSKSKQTSQQNSTPSSVDEKSDNKPPENCKSPTNSENTQSVKSEKHGKEQTKNAPKSMPRQDNAKFQMEKQGKGSWYGKQGYNNRKKTPGPNMTYPPWLAPYFPPYNPCMHSPFIYGPYSYTGSYPENSGGQKWPPGY